MRSTRPPLRTVAGPRHNQLEPKEENCVDDNAMLIDLSPQPALPTAPIRKSLVSRENTSVATRRSDAASRRPRSSLLKREQEPEEEIDEDDRAHKRRRTSSESPEDPEEEDPAALEEERLQAEEELITARIAAELEAYANDEPEADPENSPWDDLDADDADDPVMVSEYVVDIFNYLKQVEVGFVESTFHFPLLTIHCS